MGASYAAREGGTSTAEAPEGQQQQQEQQQPASQNVPSIEYIYFVLRVLKSIGEILAAEILRVLGVCKQYY